MELLPPPSNNMTADIKMTLEEVDAVYEALVKHAVTTKNDSDLLSRIRVELLEAKLTLEGARKRQPSHKEARHA